MKKGPLVAALAVIIIFAAAYWYEAAHTPASQPAASQPAAQKGIPKSAIDNARQGIAGTWQNAGAQGNLQLNVDGTAIDRYQNGTVKKGTWGLFTQEYLPDLRTINALPITDDTLYIQTIFGGTVDNYSVQTVSATSLDLTTLTAQGPGTQIHFTRVQ